jgi:hypothetical protein
MRRLADDVDVVGGLPFKKLAFYMVSFSICCALIYRTLIEKYRIQRDI